MWIWNNLNLDETAQRSSARQANLPDHSSRDGTSPRTAPNNPSVKNGAESDTEKLSIKVKEFIKGDYIGIVKLTTGKFHFHSELVNLFSMTPHELESVSGAISDLQVVMIALHKKIMTIEQLEPSGDFLCTIPPISDLTEIKAQFKVNLTKVLGAEKGSGFYNYYFQRVDCLQHRNIPILPLTGCVENVSFLLRIRQPEDRPENIQHQWQSVSASGEKRGEIGKRDGPSSPGDHSPLPELFRALVAVDDK